MSSYPPHSMEMICGSFFCACFIILDAVLPASQPLFEGFLLTPDMHSPRAKEQKEALPRASSTPIDKAEDSAAQDKPIL